MTDQNNCQGGQVAPGAQQVINMQVPHNVRGNLSVGEPNPIELRHKLIIELVVLGALIIVAFVCLGYMLLGSDKERQSLALNGFVGLTSALVGYIAGRKSS